MKPVIAAWRRQRKKQGFKLQRRRRIPSAKGIWERLRTQGEALQLSTGLKTHTATAHQGTRMGARIIWRGRSEVQQHQAGRHQMWGREEMIRRRAINGKEPNEELKPRLFLLPSASELWHFTYMFDFFHHRIRDELHRH